MFPAGFSNVELVGQGTGTKIYKAVHVATKEVVALKAFDSDTFDRAGFDREVACHRNLEHPFIARFFGVESIPGREYIVMEYVGMDSLCGRLGSAGGMLEFEAERVFAQLACALLYLHRSCNISHRDVKLENVMLDLKGNVKLIDFGVSRTQNGFMSTCCGSLPYWAPEIFAGGDYTKAVDIWATGVCLFAMVAGQLPFYDDNIVNLAHMVREEEPEYPSQITDELRDLLTRMLDKNPETRITIEEVVQHPWLQGSRFVDETARQLMTDFALEAFPRGVDYRVLRQMARLGFMTEAVARQLQNEMDTEATMIYRILKLRAKPEHAMRMRSLRHQAVSSPFFNLNLKRESVDEGELSQLCSSTPDMDEREALPLLMQPEKRRGSVNRSPKKGLLKPSPLHEHSRKCNIRSLSSCRHLVSPVPPKLTQLR